ncbi:MAG: ABC transporter ATP-binding protein [Sphingobacteriales bacterium]|nr:ABC transporter ATP-binding protein [Sphingobacteriales bacterium]
MHALLEIEKLSISFPQDTGSYEAVKGISFSLHKGKISALVGESGSGKSVTALSILQLLPPHVVVSGSAIGYFGEKYTSNLLKLPEHQIRHYRGKKIGMIFQEPMTSLNPLLTCGEQVAEAIILHLKENWADAKAKTIALFERVELPDPESVYQRYPHQLSGGQKQRVMIAMAISCRPELLIADEPTTALDVVVQKSILALIRSIQQETGMAVLLITHDLGLVADVADDIYVMKAGELVESGLVNDVLRNPVHEYTRNLLLARPTEASKGKPLAMDTDIKDQTDQKNLLVNHGAVKTFTSQKPMLKVEALSKYYQSAGNAFGKKKSAFRALTEVSFEVWPEETVGLVGESGSGKSTIGKIIAGLLQPDEGKISWNNEEMNSKSVEKKIRTAIVFQDPYGSLNPRMSIGDALGEPISLKHRSIRKDEKREKIRALLWQVGLNETAMSRYPHQFSGGQRQRICIARALATEPQFLIFDESVSALDLSIQAQILNLINELKAQLKLTCLFISHDLPVVHYISDRILVLQNGVIIESGTADQILHAPEAKYTQSLVDAIPGRAFFTN